MKIFDLECHGGCRSKYTFTILAMQWPDVIEGKKLFEEAVFGFECPKCKAKNAYRLNMLIDLRLLRALKFFKFIENKIALRQDHFFRQRKYKEVERLLARYNNAKKMVDEIENLRLELAGL